MKNRPTVITRAGISICLVATVIGSGPLRAQEENGEETDDKPDAKTGTNKSSKTRKNELESSTRAGNQNLLLPVSILDRKDTTLLRQLLLSHGLELDLSANTNLNANAFEDLLENLIRGKKASAQDAVRTYDKKSESVQLQKLREEIAASLKLGVGDQRSVSPDWDIVWFGDIPNSSEKIPPAPNPATPSQQVPSTPGTEGGPGLFVIDDAPPPGFESLGAPKDLLVDVYFLREKVGETFITVYAEDFLFEDPQTVLEMLPGVKSHNKLLRALSGRLDSNLDKICYSPNNPVDCGYVEGSPISAIYDESLLRVELFVPADFQSLRPNQRITHLPDPEPGKSFILSLGSVASKVESDEDGFDVSGRALFSYGRGHAFTEVDYNSRTERRRLQDFRLTHYFYNHAAVAGTYSYHPGGALRSMRMLGASFSKSLRTRVDQQQIFGSELVVNLANRSIVQLRVDGRVYSANSYPAGYQVLDTSSLPEGTYEVELRISDPVAGLEIEQRQFTKSTRLPPHGESVYGITLGTSLSFTEDEFVPTRSGHEMAGFSFGRRFNDQSAYHLGYFQIADQSFLNSELIYLSSRFDFKAALSLGTSQTVATSLRASYKFKGAVATFGTESFNSQYDVGSDEYLRTLYPDNFENYRLALRKNFKGFSLSGSASYRRKESEESVRSYSIRLRRDLLRRRKISGQLDIELEVENDAKRIKIGTQFFLKEGQRSSSIDGAVDRSNSGNVGYVAGVSTEWRTHKDNDVDINLGAYAKTQDDGENAGLNFGLKHRYFSGRLSTGFFNAENGTEEKNAVASVGTNWGVDYRGAAMGGADVAQAGVIISVDGEPKDARYDIIVNGQKVSSGVIGTSQFIGLQPFKSYDIKLLPRSVLSNGFGNDIYEFTLFPGTVQRIEVVAQRQYLLIGTLINKFGELLENAIIDDLVNPVTIDSSGLVQAEVKSNQFVKVRLSNGSYCQFKAPDAGNEELLVVDAPIVCKQIENPAHQ